MPDISLMPTRAGFRVGARAVLVVLLAASTVGAQTDRLVVVPELTDADLAVIDLDDQSIDDWHTVLGPPTLVPADFSANPRLNPYDPADLDYRIWLGWHDATDRIYCAIERVDDHHVNRFGEGRRARSWEMYKQDPSLNLFVDGDHSGGQVQYMYNSPEKQRRESNQQAQFYVAISQTFDDGPRVSMFENGFFYEADWFLRPPYAYGGGGSFSERPTVTVTEFYVTPFDLFVWNDEHASLKSDLREGSVINLNVGLLDFDGAASHETEQSLTQPWGFHDDSAEWVDALLTRETRAPVEELPLEAVTWARIKASFQPGPVARPIR